MTAGFVYLWHDRKRHMFYVGSHIGMPNDGYVSGSKWLRHAITKRPEDFKRRVLFSSDDISKKTLQDIEQQWLLLIKEEELGHRYYNLKRHATGGHDGSNKGRKQTEEWKAQHRAMLLGRKYDGEHRAKISAGLKGKPKSLEARQNMSLAAKERWSRCGGF